MEIVKVDVMIGREEGHLVFNHDTIEYYKHKGAMAARAIGAGVGGALGSLVGEAIAKNSSKKAGATMQWNIADVADIICEKPKKLRPTDLKIVMKSGEVQAYTISLKPEKMQPYIDQVKQYMC